MNLLLSMKLITEQQYKSLTRKYKDIPDLKKEVSVSPNWEAIKAIQKEL